MRGEIKMAFYKVGNVYYSDELYHYGIKGQKHGVRRFQNEDGSLTAAGRNRYDVGVSKAVNNPVSIPQAMFKDRKNYFTKEQGYGYGQYFDPVSSDIRFNSDRAKKRILNKDIRLEPKGFDKAVQDVKNWANKTGENVGNAVNKSVADAKNWVNNATQNVKSVASEAIDNVKEMSDKNITGDEAKKKRDNALINAKISDNENTRRGMLSPHPELYDKLEKEYGIFTANPIRQKKIDQRYDDTSKMYRDQAANAQREYNESLAGKAEKAASDAKKWTEQAAKDVGKAASDVGKAVGKAASDVGKATNKAAKDVVNWGGDAVKKGSNFISGLFGKKKK